MQIRNWRNTLGVVALTGVAVLAMSGCGAATEITPATTAETPAVEQTVPVVTPALTPAEQLAVVAPDDIPEGAPEALPEGERPAPPEGMEPGSQPPTSMIDLAAAAETLGVTEAELSEALGDLTQGPPDFAAAAEALGITEAELMEAIGMPDGGMPGGGRPPQGMDGETPPPPEQ